MAHMDKWFRYGMKKAGKYYIPKEGRLTETIAARLQPRKGFGLRVQGCPHCQYPTLKGHAPKLERHRTYRFTKICFVAEAPVVPDSE